VTGLLGPTALWGLAAAVPAVFAEYLYRVMPGTPSFMTWLRYLPLWALLQLAIGYCIYRLVTTPNTSLMDAFVVWAFSTIFMRVCVSTLILDETVKLGTWYALGLILFARVAQAFWGR